MSLFRLSPTEHRGAARISRHCSAEYTQHINVSANPYMYCPYSWLNLTVIFRLPWFSYICTHDGNRTQGLHANRQHPASVAESTPICSKFQMPRFHALQYLWAHDAAPMAALLSPKPAITSHNIICTSWDGLSISLDWNS